MKSGISVGLNKGFIVTKPEKDTRRAKPSYRKGKLGARVKLIREVVREITGFAPYEKKMMELIRTNDSKKFKKAYKIAKTRLGTHLRAKSKREELQTVIQLQRKK